MAVPNDKLEAADKSAAQIQITAEQLLREAASLSKYDEPITNEEALLTNEAEIHEYKVKKRKDFEERVLSKPHAGRFWIEYGQWEAQGLDFRRARSVFERGLKANYQNVEIWNKYIDTELKYEFVNSARNLFDRVTKYLPRIDHFWLRYALFEETVGNYQGARSVFERWMQWSPSIKAWMSYVKFEERTGELQNAREVLRRMTELHRTQEAYMKAAKWEESVRNVDGTRYWYEKAVGTVQATPLTESFFIKWARFEELQGDYGKTTAIYRKGLEVLGAGSILHGGFVNFQKRQGEVEDVEDLVLTWRKKQYEAQLEKASGYDYDLWYMLINLEQQLYPKDPERVRRLYEGVLAKKPKSDQKKDWKRYFYVLLNWAIFEEVTAKDVNRARSVYQCLADNVIPHKKFSFAKLWYLWAQFELRICVDDVTPARLVFGRAIGQYPNHKIFKRYIEMELKLGEIDRCRLVAARYVEHQPQNPRSWLALIDIELLVKDYQRANRIFEIALTHKGIQNREELWKHYISVESNLGNIQKARNLYERLFVESEHWKVLQALVEFEWKTAHDTERARQACRRAINLCKENSLDAERAAMINTWLNLEKALGSPATVKMVEEQIPRKVKKRRSVVAEDGLKYTEEYTAYIFQDEPASSSSLAIFKAAQKWRKQKEAAEAAAG
ncbi:putative crooked neck-like pre-mRNA-splicing factor [Gregarina niphandrodes]|uniref:Crooked neck-like pre-mRNA-splicing factor n=1 Tax=Gregarina niphandrodes TaxID=110365 RepID=A0A023B669_GRENI|nr:putative crooked neck-like pre-mRNA-splicing factor [Gregarina niphandrodes]EZG65629.1 putative crooked neck-like pre-mRNA-splicing factor [Gregarina niphandrodes]|eukprot:XP_011134071.1 putative crooked neck-like pre-mRNA-splicing factor [Gregarina niphandrodes]